MDDLDIGHRDTMRQQLKLWTDRYGVVLETKGGAIADSYDTFVVTSQYSIEEVWEDGPTRDAMRRRFKVIHMSDPLNLIGRASGEGSE